MLPVLALSLLQEKLTAGPPPSVSPVPTPVVTQAAKSVALDARALSRQVLPNMLLLQMVVTARCHRFVIECASAVSPDDNGGIG
jgi:hypothetical protein